MVHPNPYPSCIFCGAKADSHEHAIPKWISKRLGIKAQMYGEARGLAPPRHAISFASHRPRIFCAPCNKHFGLLEEAVAPLLERMAKGYPLAVGTETRRLLALWAAKTAMALLAAHDLRDLVPQEHRDTVRYDGRAPEAMWVGYFHWRGDPLWYVTEGNLARSTQYPANAGNTYGVVLTFAQVAFSAVGFPRGVPTGWRLDSRGRCPALQFWPLRPGLWSWPPENEETDATAITDVASFSPLVPASRGAL